jgi:RNA polymerase sigma-54 factor
VKEAILDLVKHEDGNAPLSDQEIVEMLNERGIPIARRTVAKYRDELNILPSNMRRKY